MPILFLTGYRDEEHLSCGYQFGAVDFLFKPIVPEVLRYKVAAALVELSPVDAKLKEQRNSRHQRTQQGRRGELTPRNWKNAPTEELQRLASLASPDLQEPRCTASIHAQLLAKRDRGRLDGEADQYIGVIVDSATHLQKLINSLLDFSRLVRGEPTPSSGHPAMRLWSTLFSMCAR